jgi:hypothetical protein
MLERTDAIKNEVLEPITFVLAYPTVSPCSVLVLNIVENYWYAVGSISIS